MMTHALRFANCSYQLTRTSLLIVALSVGGCESSTILGSADAGDAAAIGDASGGDTGLAPDSSATAQDGTLADGAAGNSDSSALPPQDASSGDVLLSADDPCIRCHGSRVNPAPPLSLTGKSATTERGVGAHQRHLASSSWHHAVVCSDCHNVPTAVGDPGHIDSLLPAEVTFANSDLAARDGVSPVWHGETDPSDLTCIVYCHGTSLGDGTNTTPIWNAISEPAPDCTDRCHGLPPPGDQHTGVTLTGCAACHGAVVDTNGNVRDPSLHIDGTVEATGPPGHDASWYDAAGGGTHGAAFIGGQTCSSASCHGDDLTGGGGPSCDSCHNGWKTNCTFCHGGLDNTSGAPPAAVDGETAVSVRGVGRHTEHVEASDHPAYDCALCHQVPTDALSTGHIDTSPAEVVFSGLAARITGASYNAVTGTCNNIYCHGDGQGSGGSATWTGTAACGSCHSINYSNLSGRHRNHSEIGCDQCHHGIATGAAQLVGGQTLHVDGTIDVIWGDYGTSGGMSWNAQDGSCSGQCHNNDGDTKTHTNQHW